MSIAVLIGVHDGLVIAADSATTLTVSASPGTITGVANVYNNANKVFNLCKGKPIGCATFGAGSIGRASIGTLIKDLRAALMSKEKAKKLKIDFDPDNYTMKQVAEIVSKFITDECQKQNPATQLGLNMGILLGGFSTTGDLGESWSVEIKGGKAVPPKQLRNPDQPAISWGGAAEVLQRIILGFSPAIFQVLADVSGGPGQKQVTAQQVSSQLGQLLVAKLQAPLVFAPMPIQDAIDLARFLVHAAIMYSRFSPGAPIIGGPIEIAAITRHEGFKWVNRKHYYDDSLNKEPIHGTVDRQEEN